MAKNLISGLILIRLLAQVWAPEVFFVTFITIRYQALLQAIIVCIFKENLWSKLKKMTKNLILGLI